MSQVGHTGLIFIDTGVNINEVCYCEVLRWQQLRRWSFVNARFLRFFRPIRGRQKASTSTQLNIKSEAYTDESKRQKFKMFTIWKSVWLTCLTYIDMLLFVLHFSTQKQRDKWYVGAQSDNVTLAIGNPCLNVPKFVLEIWTMFHHCCEWNGNERRSGMTRTRENLPSAGALSQTPLGELTALPQTGGEGAVCSLPKNLIPRSRPFGPRYFSRYVSESFSEILLCISPCQCQDSPSSQSRVLYWDIAS